MAKRYLSLVVALLLERARRRHILPKNLRRLALRTTNIVRRDAVDYRWPGQDRLVYTTEYDTVFDISNS